MKNKRSLMSKVSSEINRITTPSKPLKKTSANTLMIKWSCIVVRDPPYAVCT